MSCRQHQDALAEAALGSEQNAALLSHLAACDTCRAELERLRTLTGAMDRSVAQMAGGEPSPGFAARVRVRLAEESAARAAWWRGWVPALAGGAAALALVAWLLWSFAEVQAPKPTPEIAGAANPSKGVEPPPSSAAPTPSPAPSRLTLAEPPKQAAENRSRPARTRSPQVASQPAWPEVLVSGDEWNQVVKLYALALRGQVNPETAVAPDPKPLAEKFQPLAIAQLKPIPPLGETASQAAEPRK